MVGSEPQRSCVMRWRLDTILQVHLRAMGSARCWMAWARHSTNDDRSLPSRRMTRSLMLIQDVDDDGSGTADKDGFLKLVTQKVLFREPVFDEFVGGVEWYVGQWGVQDASVPPGRVEDKGVSPTREDTVSGGDAVSIMKASRGGEGHVLRSGSSRSRSKPQGSMLDDLVNVGGVLKTLLQDASDSKDPFGGDEVNMAFQAASLNSTGSGAELGPGSQILCRKWTTPCVVC